MRENQHAVIAGTGRAGTSFLVQLLTELGLDTGFEPDTVQSKLYSHARAGLEHSLLNPDCPYIVKDPNLSSYIDEIISDGQITLDHVFIPTRNLHAAAESRRKIGIQKAGGVWLGRSQSAEDDPDEQESALLEVVYNLMVSLSRLHIPVTLLHYPTLVKDYQYLHEKLKPILKDIALDEFEVVFNKVVNHKWVHSYNNEDK